MENKNTTAYRNAKKKMEILKGFYNHLWVYIAINTVLILVNAEVFNSEPNDFSDLGNYFTAFFWGIGLVCHALYTFYTLNFKNSFLKRWEEKKIQEYLEKDEF